MLIQIEVNVSEPVEVSSGVYKTTLTHPQLEGELSFITGSLINRNVIISSIKKSILGELSELASLIGDLTHGSGTTGKTPASNHAGGSTSLDT